ncbi:ISAzo13-like element transposase-related protein [Streptomyces chartreusis]|uniref:ISAzo13-like element transposase-related protein n=1 Tax=Streptomyces chartreusis TaxID=1969 RepID=UPI00386F4912
MPASRCGVDTKKKELVGDYTNAGHQWRSSLSRSLAKTHDLPDLQQPVKAIRTESTTPPQPPTGQASAPATTPPRPPPVAAPRRSRIRDRHDYPAATRLRADHRRQSPGHRALPLIFAPDSQVPHAR